MAGRKKERMRIMALGDLIGLHFPLAYSDNNAPARLSEWIAAPRQPCKRPAQESWNATHPCLFMFHAHFRHIPH
jgi:hypothetical protein